MKVFISAISILLAAAMAAPAFADDAERRHHYEKKRMLGTLDEAEAERLDYLERTLSRKYDKADRLQEYADKLKHADDE